MLAPKSADYAAPRNSSFEVLRIAAMLMVTISHASIHGGFPDDPSVIELNNHILNWFLLGNLGVNLFLLITGYFLCTKQIDSKLVLKNLTQVWFYSILCGVIYILAGGTVSAGLLLKILFPTIFKQYWFFTAYIVLILLAPYLNLFAKSASQTQFRNCLLTMVVLWCVILSFTNQDMYSSEIVQFVMYYLIGAYFRMHPENCLATAKIRNILAVGSLFLLLLSTTAIRLVNETIGHLISETSFINSFSILSLGSAVGLFASAVYHKPWVNRYVNRIASCTFGIYLLHDNPLVRSLIWRNWLDNTVWYDSWLLTFCLLISSMIVFVGCIPVELLRQKVIAKPFLNMAAKAFHTLCQKGKVVLVRK